MSSLHAREFRTFNKIPVAPKLSVTNSKLKTLAPIQKTAFKFVDSVLIEKSIRNIVASWNSEKLAHYLADTFQGKTLLLNVIRSDVPRDAVLRLLAVQSVSTIEQTLATDKVTKKRQLRSVVITTVDLQLEFNDPFNGFVRLPHTSQFYLQVVESE